MTIIYLFILKKMESDKVVKIDHYSVIKFLSKGVTGKVYLVKNDQNG